MVCCVPGCQSLSKDVIHCFPKNDTRARRWLRAINNPKLKSIHVTELHKKVKICRRHFPPEAYAKDYIYLRVLRKDAVPTLHLPEPPLRRSPSPIDYTPPLPSNEQNKIHTQISYDPTKIDIKFGTFDNV